MPVAWASARVMSFWLTPMRQPPVSSLLKTKRSVGPRLSQASRIAALRVSSSSLSSARRRAIQSAERPGVARGLGQDQRDGLGQVADDGVAGLEEPKGDACAFRRPFAQLGGGDHAARAAAGEERDAPEAVGFGGVA
jgi:hypothetical protein